MTNITNIRWKNVGGIQMENEWLKVVILPCLGGKLASVYYKETGFELAAQSKEAEYQIPRIDSQFSEYDASGLDEAFPNVVEAKVSYENGEWIYPDHGEIWSSPMEYRIEGEEVVLSYESKRFYYTYEKRVSLKENRIGMDYKIENQKEEVFPCLWTFHGLIRYEEDMELLYPKEVKSFENVLPCSELGRAGRHIPLDNQEYDFCKVPLRNAFTMVKYYADQKLEEGFCGCRYPSQGMEYLLEYDAKKLPYLGIWITAGGFRGDYNCAIEPSNGYYDDIFIADKNKSLYRLEKEKPLIFRINISIQKQAETRRRE